MSIANRRIGGDSEAATLPVLRQMRLDWCIREILEPTHLFAI